MNHDPNARRNFLRAGSSGLGLAGLGSSALSSLLTRTAGAADPVSPGPHFPPTARRVIWLFMGGGPSQLDLSDYKPGLTARFDQDLPDSVRNGQRLTGMTANQARRPIAPSRFSFEQSGQSGAWVSELLPYTRRIVDDIAIVKTVSTESINHDLGVSNINTGSQQPGKPSLGAWLSYGLGPVHEDVPAFMVMTSRFTLNPFVQPLSARFWGSSFLPANHGGVPMRGVGDPVLYLPEPRGHHAKLAAHHAGRAGQVERAGRRRQWRSNDQRAHEPIRARLPHAGSVPGLTQSTGESDATLALYGDDVRTPGTFAANCIAARRSWKKACAACRSITEAGTPTKRRRNCSRNQCKDVDQACYGLITDLKQRGLLDDTLADWGGEFGRTGLLSGHPHP